MGEALIKQQVDAAHPGGPEPEAGQPAPR